ncbi:MAG: hypothetical protein NZ772_13730 [Cyanobacteria bacterium]|nr:hypothetical protein [Cyanobacteriota bacterium]MDW8202452.1 hypothetical protein [Cyanobacteriota bacterium SKYGB_h_bin112]
MNHHSFSYDARSIAPCVVDQGIVVNRQDMQRLLTDLSHVRYAYWCDGQLASEDEGCVLEVFADPQRSTLIANHSLYINLCSFDYLQLGYSTDHQPCFELIQESRRLQLIPLCNPLRDQATRDLNAATLEAVVAEVLSEGWDVQLDDDDDCSNSAF